MSWGHNYGGTRSGYARLGPLTVRLGLYLATYCGIMITTLAAARDPIIRLLDRWETVSHIIISVSTHIVQNTDALVWFPDPSCMGGAQTLPVGVRRAPRHTRRSNYRQTAFKQRLYRTSVPYFSFLQPFQLAWKCYQDGYKTNYSYIWFHD